MDETKITEVYSPHTYLQIISDRNLLGTITDVYAFLNRVQAI